MRDVGGKEPTEKRTSHYAKLATKRKASFDQNQEYQTWHNGGNPDVGSFIFLIIYARKNFEGKDEKKFQKGEEEKGGGGV